MNNLQKIASAIGGYGFDETSAKDDGFYNETTGYGKLGYIIALSSNGEGLCDVDYYEANQILRFLTDFYKDGGNMLQAFKALGN